MKLLVSISFEKNNLEQIQMLPMRGTLMKKFLTKRRNLTKVQLTNDFLKNTNFPIKTYLKTLCLIQTNQSNTKARLVNR